MKAACFTASPEVAPQDLTQGTHVAAGTVNGKQGAAREGSNTLWLCGRFLLIASGSILSALPLLVAEKSVNLKITTRANGIATIMEVTGEISLYNAPEFRNALMDLLKAKKAPRVIVDMTHVRYIDSAGVACLVEALKVTRESKLGFALFGLSREAKEVLELTRLIRVFEVYGTEEEALRGGLASSSSSGAAV